MTNYEAEIHEIRHKKHEQVRSETFHWLNLAGLFRLEEGKNSFGSDPKNHIAVPGFPQLFCGTLDFNNGLVTFHPEKDVKFSSKLANPTTRPLTTDAEKESDLITIGPIAMKVIVRGNTTLVRAWDKDAPAKVNFTEFKYYPANEAYRVRAKYVRYENPRIVPRLDMIGTESEGQILGQAQFIVNGVACTLEAEKSGDEMVLHFTDGTSGKTTYGGGRRIYLPIPKGDEFILDFNLVTNWPCAYTPYATCPMVLKENRMPVSIEAGEKNYFDR